MFQQRPYQYCHVLRNRPDAEEGLQEAFARVWRRAAGVDAGRGAGMTWLITIGRNDANDQRQLRRIVVCLNRLEPAHAAAVKAAYLNGMSYDDLARTYAVPLNTMRTWLRRSLQKLRDCVAEG